MDARHQRVALAAVSRREVELLAAAFSGWLSSAQRSRRASAAAARAAAEADAQAARAWAALQQDAAQAAAAATAAAVRGGEAALAAAARDAVASSSGLLLLTSLAAAPLGVPSPAAARARHLAMRLDCTTTDTGGWGGGGLVALAGGARAGEPLADWPLAVLELSPADGGDSAWHAVEQAGDAPPPSLDAAACALGGDAFAAVGGVDEGGEEHARVHVCRIERSGGGAGGGAPAFLARWEALPPAAALAPSPAGRVAHSAVAHAGRVYVFGGYSAAGGEVLGDLWAYELAARAWRRVAAASGGPPPRRSHAVAVAGGHMFLFGGAGAGGALLGDTWAFSFDSESWAPLPPAPGRAAPPPRRSAALEPLAGGRQLLLHGGRGAAAELADCYVLDLAASAGGGGGGWTAVGVHASGGWQAPPARSMHTVTLVGHRLLVLGGVGPGGGACAQPAQLHQPALTEGLRLRARLSAAEARAAAAAPAAAAAAARLAEARHREAAAAAGRAAAEARAADAAAKLRRLERRAAEMQADAHSARALVLAAQAAAAAAGARVAKAERRLAVVREGGRELAGCMYALTSRAAAAEGRADALSSRLRDAEAEADGWRRGLSLSAPSHE